MTYLEIEGAQVQEEGGEDRVLFCVSNPSNVVRDVVACVKVPKGQGVEWCKRVLDVEPDTNVYPQ